MDDKNSFEIKYIFEDNYNPVYVNGAYGGTTPKNEIIINFYLERHPLPKSQFFEIEGSKVDMNRLIKNEPNNFDKSLVRYITNGVVLNLQSAKELHAWLTDKIKLIEGEIK